jgi:hypothetical protein
MIAPGSPNRMLKPQTLARPQTRTPGVAQRHTVQRMALQPAFPRATSRTIQRAQKIPGMPGFLEGSLTGNQLKGTRNDVFSQPSTPFGYDPIAHASASLTNQAKSHVSEYTHIDHLGEDGNTHAEDKLIFHVYQLIALQYKSGPYPDKINFTLDYLYITASPCSSAFGTSDKSTGCTENLINWHKNGMNFRVDDGASHITVYLTIAKLEVHHLYKSTSKENAAKSFQALQKLKTEGAITAWKISGPGAEWKHGNEQSDNWA